jgi:predicted nucleic acid-binding protein
MKRVLVDANIALDLLLQREAAEKSEAALRESATLYFISALTVHLLYHFGEQENINHNAIAAVIDLFETLGIDKSTVKLAQSRYKDKEFEDCLQAACAELHNCDEILTRDRKFTKFSGTVLPVMVLA